MRPPTNRPGTAGPLHLLVLVAAGLLAALYLAWRTLAAVDFLYPVLYEPAGIGAHIDLYGPKNRYKRGFAETTRAEREALFSEIARSIRNHGRGLESLTYHDSNGRELGVLLRSPEIIHLRDVATLVHRLEISGLMALAVLAFHVVFLRRRGLRLPGAGRMFFLTTGAVLLSAALVLVSGPRRVFYALHEQVFPPDNQWFFFYQDSLMSTMMKAPFLFGYIAVALVVLALIYLWILFLLASAVTARQSPPPP
ncbi:MAG: DUF1461 domain-containing protein [Gammaproteobacteria bacterium]